ncbi:hypothetical protein HDV00_009718 [Rhizophlyctis rosea]|nr:hypothetical protein HDV00_009718 [Rhizophlyctis rosea]
MAAGIPNETAARKLNVLMVGAGEYTTGYTQMGASKSDKSKGVVFLVLADMRRRGKIGKISMCATTGKRNAAIREHLKTQFSVYKDISPEVEFTVPDDVARDAEAYKAAIDNMTPGDGVTIFTPDDTHFDIALYAIRRGLHVLITKPAAKTLAEQKILIAEAKRNNVLCMVEFHKRFDPIYADAVARIRTFGDFSYFTSWMAQPKFQLQVFKSWAGVSSDISYCKCISPPPNTNLISVTNTTTAHPDLNSHHIDIHTWAIQDIATPLTVTASASTGVATSEPYSCAPGTEDTITLMTRYRNNKSGSTGTAIYTASWIAPKSETHTHQRIHYMGHNGEIRCDQAHRGYDVTTDDNGYMSPNPLYMRYAPDARGYYAGQNCYSHMSIEAWGDACLAIKEGRAQVEDFETSLPTVRATAVTTAILEAGRKSLDAGGVPVEVESWEV